ncbi:hypothetical protein D9Q98_005309 [Chlorella vulgaris]|uniref:PDZ domain-containing protein n=1 Tax=Chlorella vulgaris TaxID=3077 RepID=A0A9D4YX47_CHLVU|nr:hypothetical protein D9Q98_005309 [Chlorella vulgaris]
MADAEGGLAPELAEREAQLGETAAVEVASGAWKQALDAVVPAVVVLKVTQTRAFDTESAGRSSATGFVVDASLGLILTNRHVVTPGPVVAEAIFLNREEVPVVPIYYDPVHDFGFMRFDPARLQFMQAVEIPLAPDEATVGLDIRVVGNDSGEKISILSGTLARLDRDAPHYGRKGYNDFNCHYQQAASGTKGGSSGSPVVNIRGQAVGLNAGSNNKAASAYYLHLHRVVRALRLIQSCRQPDGSWVQPCIPRGDLQATFVFKGYDEVRRLGLRKETEEAVRACKQLEAGSATVLDGRPGSTGMLVVESVVPGGPADGVLEPGDMLVRLNGRILTEFRSMEELLDDSVGGAVRVEVERGGAPLAADVRVQDLQGVTPSVLLELAGGSVNELSYQQARNNRAAVGQVYVSEPGYLLGKAGVSKHAIITAVAGTPTPNLTALVEALKCLRHGQRVPIQFFSFGDRHRRKSSILHINWAWYGSPRVWTRNNAAGTWDCKEEAAASEAAAKQRPPMHPGAASGAGADASLPAGASGGLSGGLIGAGSIPRKHSVPSIPAQEEVERKQAGVTAQADDARLLGSPSAKAAAAVGVGAAFAGGLGGEGVQAGPKWRPLLEEQLRCGLTQVDVEIPTVALTDGVRSRSFRGCGVIVYQSETLGLVVVDRNTVSVSTGDVLLSFGAYPAELPAAVRFLHPLHNFGLVSYDPRQLAEEARRLIRPLRLAPFPPLRRGDSVELVCLSKSLRILHRTSTVTNPATSVSIRRAEVPRFRAVHEEVVRLDLDLGMESGVLCDRSGGVRALWCSYSEQVSKAEVQWIAGLPAAIAEPWVTRLVVVHERQQAQQQQQQAPAEAAAAAESEGGVGSGSGAVAAAGVMLPPPLVATLDAELEPLLLSKAAQFGLPSEWVSRLVALDGERRQVLRVRSCLAGSDARRVLRDADLVLAIGGQPISSFNDVERVIVQAAAAAETAAVVAVSPPGAGAGAPGTSGVPGSAAGQQDQEAPPMKRARVAASEGVEQAGLATGMEVDVGQPVAPAVPTAVPAAVPVPAQAQLPEVSLSLTIFRDGEVQEVAVRLGQEDGLGTDRLVHWCGAQLQYPHRGVRELGHLPERHGVYISRWHHGSPAHRYGLSALHWVSEVNGHPTPDLDTFIAVVRQLADGADVRVRLLHLGSGKSKVLTLKTDHRYWPTSQLVLDKCSGEWTRQAIGSLV